MAKRHGYVDALLYKGMWHLADFIYDSRLIFLVVPILITLCCSTGFVFMEEQVSKSIDQSINRSIDQ